MENIKGYMKEAGGIEQVRSSLEHLRRRGAEEPANFQAAFDLAGVYLQLQQTDRAVPVLEGVLNHPQADAAALRSLLQAYGSFGNNAGLQKTVEKFEALVRANPANFHAASGLAEGYRRVKNDEAAIQTLDQGGQ